MTSHIRITRKIRSLFRAPHLLCRATQPLSADANILKDYLYCMLGAVENVACLRARSIVGDKITEPWLFFSASEELGEWCVLDLAPLVDMTLAALEAGAEVRMPASGRARAWCRAASRAAARAVVCVCARARVHIRC